MANRSLSLLKSPQHILVRMPNWLGDLVMATPILTDLRHHWPAAKITAMCQGSLGAVIQEDPHVDEVFSFQRSKGKFSTQTYRDMIHFLKAGKFDLGILLTNSFSSAYWFWKGDVYHRIGYATHWRSCLLNYAIPLSPDYQYQHLVLTYKTLLTPLGIPLSQTSPRLYLTSKERQLAKNRLVHLGVQTSDVLIGIHPGAAYGSAKCWLPERFQELCQQLLDHVNIKIIFFGDLSGVPLAQKICASLPSHRLINFTGKTTLRELIAFIQNCKIFLTNDSGPMHIASALEVPLIALFGSTSEITTGPYRGGHVIHKHVACSPCYRRECPIDFRCMTSIEVTEVYEEIKKMIQPTPDLFPL